VKRNNSIPDDVKIVDLLSIPSLNLNPLIIEVYGLSTALWISFLLNSWTIYRSFGLIDYRGFFTINKKEIKNYTQLKYGKQTSIIKNLVRDKVLEVEKRGTPPQNHYKINLVRLSRICFKRTKKFFSFSNKNNKLIDPSLENEALDFLSQSKNISSSSNKNNKLHVPSLENRTTAKNFLIYNNIYFSFSSILFNNILNNISKKENDFSNEKSKPSISSTYKKPKLKLRSKPLQIKNKSKLLSERDLSYQDQEEDIFDYWVNLGSPLTKHRKKTKTHYKARKIIQKHLQKYSAEQIKQAITNYYKLLTDEESWVCVRARQSKLGYIVSITDFFKFSKNLIELMKAKNVGLSFSSWFRECVDVDYNELKNKYGNFIEVSDPVLARAFRTGWKKKVKRNPTIKEENKIREASRKFKLFLEKNVHQLILSENEKQNPEKLVPYVFEAISKDVRSDWKIVTAGWLSSDRTYEVRLPFYLESIGVMNPVEQEDEEEIKQEFNIYDFKG